MTDHNDSFAAPIVKVAVAWLGTIAGMQLSEWVLLATLIYTLLQIFFLIKHKGKK